MALKQDKSVLMIMADALRHDYITPDDAPFLHGLQQKGAYGSLVPTFGFEPDCAYFAGLNPEECDGGAQYWRNANERLFYLTGIFGLLHRIPSPWWRKNVRRAVRLVAQLLAKDSLTKKMASSGQIPLNMLSQFSMPMKKLACEPGFSPAPSIFDVIRKSGGDFYFHGFPAYSVHTDIVVERYLVKERGGHDLAFLFLGDLDGIGHRYGPQSRERKEMLRHLDAGIKMIYEHARGQYRDVDILVFGDHGMAEVANLIDLRDAIARAGLDRKEDSYFLDSTFARFWVKNIARRDRLIELLMQQSGGHVLTETEKDKFRIRYPHNYFGDIIYVVNDGLLIHPNFYCSDQPPPKGMHGYLPGCRDNESAFVLSSTRANGLGDLGRIDMKRVYPTILDLLGLMHTNPIPNNLQSILA